MVRSLEANRADRGYRSPLKREGKGTQFSAQHEAEERHASISLTVGFLYLSLEEEKVTHRLTPSKGKERKNHKGLVYAPIVTKKVRDVVLIKQEERWHEIHCRIRETEGPCFISERGGDVKNIARKKKKGGAGGEGGRKG